MNLYGILFGYENRVFSMKVLVSCSVTPSGSFSVTNSILIFILEHISTYWIHNLSSTAIRGWQCLSHLLASLSTYFLLRGMICLRRIWQEWSAKGSGCEAKTILFTVWLHPNTASFIIYVIYVIYVSSVGSWWTIAKEWWLIPQRFWVAERNFGSDRKLSRLVVPGLGSEQKQTSHWRIERCRKEKSAALLLSFFHKLSIRNQDGR